MVFVATLLFLPVFYIFHPSLVVELAHLGVQTRARRSTVMRRPYPSICRLRHVSVVAALCCWPGIFLLLILQRLACVSIWGVPGLEVDLFVYEVRTFDRHLPACDKVDQSEAIFLCTLMQAVLAYRWLMCGFSANVCVR
jgi:hypothetical protein